MSDDNLAKLPELDHEGMIEGFCTGCLSVLPDGYTAKDKFLQNGLRGVCPYCKGPTILIPAGRSEHIADRIRNGDQLL